MYYPYLYGRAAELRAVAAAAGDFGAPQRITPVLEPAFQPGTNLSGYTAKLGRTLTMLQSNGAVAYVVSNPHQGGFASLAAVATWQRDMAAMVADPTMSRPTFKVHSGVTAADLTSFLALHHGLGLGLVVADERVIPAAQLAAAIGSANVRVFVLPGVDSGAYVTAFGAGRVVRVMENFKAKDRNADYSGNELLASNHITSPGGFADFTILSSELRFGGGRPGAAVVHLTFQLPAGELWVEHFVSDETDVNEGNFSTKLLEALDHMAIDIASSPAKFEVSPAVVDYQGQRTTGLSTNASKNKTLQIWHHLYVVARHLGI